MNNALRMTMLAIFVCTVCVVFVLFSSCLEVNALPAISRVSWSDSMQQTRTIVTVSPRQQNRPRNIHHKIGNCNRSSSETERLRGVDTRADCVLTETGNIKTLVVNKMIKAYYTPRKKIVNPIDAKFIISGAQICSTDAKYMTILIIVPSIPRHNFVRDAIRSTYGSYSKRTFTIEHTAVDVTVRLLFVVGKDGNIESDRTIRNESRAYGDMMYADFTDSYRNLTRKMLIALKWISVYCSDVDFVMKVDEDVFVNIPQLAEELHRRPYGIKGAVYGHTIAKNNVLRKGKWGVTKGEFPLTHYPKYVSGTSYVISGNIVPHLFMISQYLPYMPIEDAFITGCLRKIVKAEVVSVSGFSYWMQPVPDPCQFSRDKNVSATKVTISNMSEFWKACNSFSETCAKFS